MELKKELQYIRNFIGTLSDEELKTALDECGNSTILPADAIREEGIV